MHKALSARLFIYEMNRTKVNDFNKKGLETVFSNQLAGYEGHYASIVYCYFASLGLDVTPEVSTNKGRIDLVLRFAGRVYIIEFKVNELTGSGKALEQILKKGYAEQFVSRNPDGTDCPVYLVGATPAAVSGCHARPLLHHASDSVHPSTSIPDSINALSFFRSHLPSILHSQLSILHYPWFHPIMDAGARTNTKVWKSGYRRQDRLWWF
jgi:hypothetical protein